MSNIIKFELLKMFVKYKLSRLGLIKTPMPITLTFSVTNMCQSRCKTCYLWNLYKSKPDLLKKELTLDEIEKIFKSIGHVYFFNISGGEPFLRKDLPQIVDLACKYLKPDIIHTPTNGLAPELIEKQTKKILEIMKENKTNIPFTIKPSFDGVGNKHDKIRGVKGNFKKVLDTYARLKKLKKKYKNLHVGLGTVISKFNVKDVKEIVEYVNKLKPDSYISEIAEQRSELFTLNKDITPKVDDYEKAISYFSENIRKTLKKQSRLTRFTQAFRLVYYGIVVRIMKERRQVIPCYAGVSNVHLTPYGDLWPCCILGYKKPIGNLRKADYDFKKIWHSKKAKKVRKYIKQGRCYCPFANQSYSNIMISFRSMLKVIKNIIFA